MPYTAHRSTFLKSSRNTSVSAVNKPHAFLLEEEGGYRTVSERSIGVVYVCPLISRYEIVK